MKRKIISTLLAAGILSSAFSGIHLTASAAEVGTKWKFDFGPASQIVASGYLGVTPATEFNETELGGIRYGLFGQNENDYKMQSHEDGVNVVQGQVVSYAGAGSGSAATNDCVGIGTLDAGQTEGIYPIRFAMDAENNGYYEVKVSVTTLDSSKPAQGVFVYSERRHPIVTNKTIAAGATETVTFRATVQSVLVKDRANGGVAVPYVDTKLNVLVMGDNAAISAIEVEKIAPSTTKTIWCYDDSTGCDYPMALPYFPLQNYGGTAQYLSKYLPNNIALVNQGDGGLASNATSYFNLCKSNFKAGDYVYLQYGHNEGSVAGYLKNLPTYYKAAHAASATMVYAGPIDRHHENQYTAATNTWSSSLSGISAAAKKYTEILICAGADAGDTFVSKAQTSMDDANAYYADIIAAGITASGVTDVAFVDLNAPTLAWLSQVCDEVKTAQGASSYSSAFSDYYFRSARGTSVDGTHENDYGADATASFFFDGINAKASAAAGTIEAVEYAALSPLVTNMRAAYGSWDHANTDYYTNGVYTQGAAPNSMWPVVYKSSSAAAYPTAVKSVTWNDDGTVASVAIVKQESTMSMDDYGMLKLDIYDSSNTLKGTIKSSQVDNTWGDGTTTTFAVGDENNQLTGDTTTKYVKADGDTYTATIYRASKGDGSVLNYITPLEAYSETYVPTDYEGALITNEDGNEVEDFNFYGAKYDGTANAAGYNSWLLNGSASPSAKLNKDGNYYYVKSAFNDTTGSQSMNLCKKFESSPSVKSNGRLKMTVDLRNATNTNTGGINFTPASNFSGNYPQGESMNLFMVCGDKVYVNGNTSYNAGDVSGSTWTTVTAEADLDRGTITVKVGDGTAVTAPISGLQKNIGASPTSLNGLCICKGSTTNKAKCSASVEISNLSLKKYSSDDELGTKTLTLAKTGNGTMQVNGAAAESVTVTQSQPVTVKAVPADFYTFTNWTDADGNVLSEDATYTYPRLYADATITANFTSIYGEGYEVSYINGFKDDFEGETNIFGSTDIIDTTTYDAASVFGNVMRVADAGGTVTLDEAISLNARAYIDLSFNVFYAWLSSGKATTVSVNDNDGNEIVGYTYTTGSSSVTDVRIGGATVDGFEAFGFAAGSRGFETSSGRYSFTSSNNAGLVSIRISGDKTVSISFANKATQSFTGTLANAVTVKSIAIDNKQTTNAARTMGIDNIDAMLVTAPTPTHSYTVNAVDENGAVISTIATGTADEAADVTIPAIHEVITDGSGNYYRLNDNSLTGYAKTFTMGTADKTETISYERNDNIVFFREAESADGTNTQYSGGDKAYIGGQNVRDRGVQVGTLPAGLYKFTVVMAERNGRAVVLRQGTNDPFASIATSKTDSSTAGLREVEFTLDAETGSVVCNGANSGTSKTNQSETFDYVLIERVVPTLQDEIAESGNTTIYGVYDGENATVPANATVTIADGASITNGNLTAVSGKITVVVSGSTISNASSVRFDGSGKITPSDGAVISTPNKADGSKTDKGFFITKNATAGDTLTFTINGHEKTAEYNGTITGDVLFGIFVTGIPANADVTVE
ncbi:MAG: hypothetical protein IJH37_07890 [Clostridia bacterium]|nr:hypothetical protein [Clostridia bacterium]